MYQYFNLKWEESMNAQGWWWVSWVCFLCLRSAGTEAKKKTKITIKTTPFKLCLFSSRGWMWRQCSSQRFTVWGGPFALFWMSISGSMTMAHLVFTQIHKHGTSFVVHFSSMHKLATLSQIDSVPRKVRTMCSTIHWSSFIRKEKHGSEPCQIIGCLWYQSASSCNK